MEQRKHTGLFGLLGIIGCVSLYFISRSFFPTLSTMLLWLFGIAVALIVLLVAVVLYLAFHKPKKTPEQERKDAQETVLKQAKSSLIDLKTGAMRIRDPKIRDSAERICSTLDQILRELNDHPDGLPKARTFLNHSLPMLSGILRKYAHLERSGILTEDVTEKAISCLRNLEAAAQTQYTNLFQNDIVDITTDMEVLTQLCRQNGLLEDPIQL